MNYKLQINDINLKAAKKSYMIFDSVGKCLPKKIIIII